MKTNKPSRAADKLRPIVLLLSGAEVRHVLMLIDDSDNLGRWDSQTDKWTYPRDLSLKIRKQNGGLTGTEARREAR